jgi:replicative DNA helicase
MDYDAAAIRLAVKNIVSFNEFIRIGLNDDLLVQNKAKISWKLINDYLKEYNALPPAQLIKEKTGYDFNSISEDDNDLTVRAVMDKLFDRHRYIFLRGGLEESVKHFEDDKFKECEQSVIELADRLKKEKFKSSGIKTLADIIPEAQELYERTKRGDVGIEFPWPLMTSVTMGMLEGTVTFFVARPGLGKCVKFDTMLVNPETGIPSTIENVCKNSKLNHVPTWSKNDGVYSIPIANKLDTGTMECFEIKTRTGRSIKCSADHPLLSPEGWKKKDELSVGDTVGLPSKMPHPTKPVMLPDHEIDLLSIVLTQGSVSHRSASFRTIDPVVVDIAENISKSVGVILKNTRDMEYYFTKHKGDYRNHVIDVLRKYGVFGMLSKNKTIPNEIYSLPPEQLSRFLSIFFMCDGYVSKDGEPGITLASEKMVYQLQSLLLRFGIQSSVNYKQATCEGKKFDAWRLHVYRGSLQNFYSSIPLWGEKAERLKQYCEDEETKRNIFLGRPRISDELKQKIKDISKSGAGRWRGGLHEKVAEKLGANHFETRQLFSGKNFIKMKAFKAFCEVYDIEDEYSWWWDSDVFWDEIVSIESVGEKKVYDLSIFPTSCYVANDMIVHNSWTILKIAWHAFRNQGKKVLVVSPEMSSEELGERLVATEGQLGFGNMVEAKLGMFGEKKLYKTYEEMKAMEGFYLLEDEDRMNPEGVENAVDQLDPDLICIDSVYMMRVEAGRVKSGPGSRGARQERLVDTIEWIRRLARKKQKPVVGVSQLSRDAKLRKGSAEYIKKGKGTGGLENTVALSDTLFWSSHNLFALFQDDDMKESKRLMYVPLKARRQARWTSIVTRWDLDLMNFEEEGSFYKSNYESEYQDQEYDLVY